MKTRERTRVRRSLALTAGLVLALLGATRGNEREPRHR